jgi:hypothetical protein
MDISLKESTTFKARKEAFQAIIHDKTDLYDTVTLNNHYVP